MTHICCGGIQGHDMRQKTPPRGKREQPSPAYGKTVIRIMTAIFVALVILLNLFTHIFSVVRYYGDGMEPALRDRQVLLIRKTEEARPGDIIAYYYNNKVLVRRVICTGGSVIQMDDAGLVVVDGEPLEEPYVAEPSIGQCNILFPCNVPIHHYFVMGDNRPIAMDSRLAEIGPIPKDRVMGKVLFVD